MLTDLWSRDAPHEEPSLLVHVQDGDRQRPRMVVTGDLDGPNAGPLQRAVIDVLRRLQPGLIDVDLGGVTFLDSAGIRALVLCQADADQMSCRLVVRNPQPAAYRVLQVCGLLEHFGLAKPRPEQPLPRTFGAAMGLVNCGLSGGGAR